MWNSNIGQYNCFKDKLCYTSFAKKFQESASFLKDELGVYSITFNFISFEDIHYGSIAFFLLLFIHHNHFKQVVITLSDLV